MEISGRAGVAAGAAVALIAAQVALIATATELPVFGYLVFLQLAVSALLSYFLFVVLHERRTSTKTLASAGVCLAYAAAAWQPLTAQYERERRTRFTAHYGSFIVRGRSAAIRAWERIDDGWMPNELDLVQFVRLTNSSNAPLQIDGYSLEANLDGGWKEVQRVIIGSPHVVEVRNAVDGSEYIDFSQHTLERAIESVIQPGHSVEGWAFFLVINDRDRYFLQNNSGTTRLIISDTTGFKTRPQELQLSNEATEREKARLVFQLTSLRPPWDGQPSPFLSVNVDDYCQRRGGGAARYLSLFGWLCSNGSPVNLQLACAEQYPGARVGGFMSPPGGRNNWRCRPR